VRLFGRRHGEDVLTCDESGGGGGGQFEPDRGVTILIGGASIVGAAQERSGIGMAFPEFRVLPANDRASDIASGLRDEGGDGSARFIEVQAISRLMKIEHVLDHVPLFFFFFQ